MREIKFRAWDIDQTIREVYAVDWFYGKVSMSHVSGYPHERNLADIVLMQYTGLKDRNGKEIYEGDIVRIHRYRNSKSEGNSVVEWYKEDACFAMIVDGWEVWHFMVRNLSDFEVIGNIYEKED